ncbi:hypothetical protein SAMN05660816_01668 [Niastella yeongjuensis]|nr:hypothetical protein SAMN05660816_01668 [Niastella yeongjuensis]
MKFPNLVPPASYFLILASYLVNYPMTINNLTYTHQRYLSVFDTIFVRFYHRHT